MTNCNNFHWAALGLAFLVLTGCVTEPQLEKVLDPRLDQLVSQMDQSLQNQATASAQLQAQQTQMEQQQQDLMALKDNIGKALQPAESEACPEPVACPAVRETSGKLMVGGLENVWFPDLGLALTARIDTGALTASLDARDIELFERDGKRWVRFSIVKPNTETSETLERRLVRTIGVQQSGSTKAKRRPVVKMGIVLGQFDQTAEFSLSDRSHMGYQVKIGRSILKDVMVVDVSKTNIAPFVLPDETPAKAGAAQ
jgi:hypothetical protein